MEYSIQYSMRPNSFWDFGAL